jgi:hypothetical protein
MLDVITIQNMKHNVCCSDFGISTTSKQYNQTVLKSTIACARHTGASDKKSIRWIFCLRARVNDASDYQWGVRLSTGKKFAASTMRSHAFQWHCIWVHFSFSLYQLKYATINLGYYAARCDRKFWIIAYPVKFHK